MKKINGMSNISGSLIRKYRESKDYSKADVSRKLELLGINMDVTEIKRIESNRQIIKDFELLGFCIILEINYDELKSLLL